MRCRLLLLFACAFTFLLPVGAFAGNEEEDTQAPAVSPTPSITVGVDASVAKDNPPIARELVDEPDAVRSRLRWWMPVAGKQWVGGHSADVSSSREGTVRAWMRSPSGKRLELRATADRRPLAFRTRVPFATDDLEDAGDHREGIRMSFVAPIPSRRGRLDVFAEWRGDGGLRPSTSAAYAPGDAGPAFRAPAWREGARGSGSAGAMARGDFAGARVALDGRIADETSRTTFHAPDVLDSDGGLTLANDERRRTGELGVSVDVPRGALVAGGSYRVRASQGEGHGSRREDTPTALPGETRLDDTDTSSLTHRASIGAAFLPISSVRTGVTATAVSERIRAESLEKRDLADDSIAKGEASVDRFGTTLAADASWFALSWMSVDARADFETARIDDEWTQTLLSPGGFSTVSSRSQALTRDRAYSKLEGSATAGPWRTVRLTAGATSETESFDVVSSRAVDSPLLGDRSRERLTLFAKLRARPVAGMTLDAHAKTFEEERDLGETTPTHRGTELRGRAGYARFGGSVFVLTALTDDRYELASLPADAVAAGFLPIDFDGRSWICSSGIAAPLPKSKSWRASATATQVVHARDLDSRLLDVAADVSGPLNERLRLSAGVRRLEWRDDRAPWTDADALVGFVLLSGPL